MWHVVSGSWNGAAAAAMYAGPLAAALKKTWGVKRRYAIVEDGDLGLLHGVVEHILVLHRCGVVFGSPIPSLSRAASFTAAR